MRTTIAAVSSNATTGIPDRQDNCSAMARAIIPTSARSCMDPICQWRMACTILCLGVSTFYAALRRLIRTKSSRPSVALGPCQSLTVQAMSLVPTPIAVTASVPITTPLHIGHANPPGRLPLRIKTVCSLSDKVGALASSDARMPPVSRSIQPLILTSVPSRNRLPSQAWVASSSGGCSLVDCRGRGGCASCVVVVA